jgi:hypothetical protein
MSEPLTGKISNIIDSYTVALNIGKNKNVTKGMRFKILTKKIEIKDPERGEVLGSMEFEKARVEISKVYEKFSLAETYGTVSTSLSPMFTFSTSVQKQLPIAAASQEIDRMVKVGDDVVQITEEASPPE